MENAYPLGKFIQEARKKKGYSIREVCRKIEESGVAGVSVSPAYFSQVETGNGINSDKVSMDFFWAVGVILEVDPLTLFVLSRPLIPQRYVEAKNRKLLFNE